MYSARRKKTERFKEFWHKYHAKHRANRRNDHRDTNYPAAYEPNSSPAIRSQSASPPSRRDNDRDLIYFEPDPVYCNSPPLQSSTFSSDYERYMRVRNMNMERIRELHKSGSSNYDYSTTSNPTNYYDYFTSSYPTSSNSTTSARPSGISPIEQELLNMVSFASPLPSYNPYSSNGRSTPPPAAPVSISLFFIFASSCLSFIFVVPFFRLPFLV
jgi:hypothetical protein